MKKQKNVETKTASIDYGLFSARSDCSRWYTDPAIPKGRVWRTQYEFCKYAAGTRGVRRAKD